MCARFNMAPRARRELPTKRASESRDRQDAAGKQATASGEVSVKEKGA